MQGIVAFGMTMVIIAGEIDLSVGSTVAFSGCLAAWVVGALSGPGHRVGVSAAVALGCLAGAAAGTGVGCLTGLLRARYRVPTFIATLAWLTVLRGGAPLITNGFPLTTFPEWFSCLGGAYLLGVPLPAVIFVVVFAVTYVVMHRTAFGRASYAVG